MASESETDPEEEEFSSTEQEQKPPPSVVVESESETSSESESNDSNNKLYDKEDDTHKDDTQQKRQLIVSKIQNSGDSKRDAKKLKGNSTPAADDSSKKPFDRVWSEDDELILLKGMIEFFSMKGLQATVDMEAFHQFIKKSIHFDVSRKQVADKVRRLRCKFEKHAAKMKVGVHPKFNRPIEVEAFELSKKIWTVERPNGKAETEGVIKNGMTRTQVTFDTNLQVPFCFRGLTQVQKSLGIIAMDEHMMRRGLELMDSSKREELVKKWEDFLDKEIALALKRAEVALDITSAISKAFVSSNT